MSNRVSTPFPVFNDKDGSPLSGGSIFIGEQYKNPIASPIQIFYDSSLQVPAEQPVRTMNGYVVKNGSVREIFSSEPIVSIAVKNKKGELVWSSPSVNLNPGVTTSAVIDQESGMTQEQLNALFLRSDQNLDDLQDKEAARENLDVYSKEEVDEKAPQATEEIAGVSKITTEELVKAGVDDETFVTPKKLRMALSADDEVPIFACRAWVCFNGSNGEVKAHGNIKSVVRNSVGDYTINFEKEMPHENYSWMANGRDNDSTGDVHISQSSAGIKTKAMIQIRVINASSAPFDSPELCLSVIC